MNMAVPPRQATDAARGNIPANLHKLRRGQNPDSVNTSAMPMSLRNSQYKDPTERNGDNIRPLPSMPSRNYDLPVQRRPIANKDNPWEDIPGAIVPRELNPWEEGTPQAFGGTAGSIVAPDPASLPNVPRSEAGLRTNQSVPDSPLDESNRNIAVLNRNTLFSLSDYERIMLMKERDKLQEFSRQANFDLKHMAESRRFYNLSLEEIARNMVLAVVAIFVDVLKFFSPEEKEKREDMTYMQSANRFAMIFLQQERLMYFGVFLVFLSAIFMVVFLSS